MVGRWMGGGATVLKEHIARILIGAEKRLIKDMERDVGNGSSRDREHNKEHPI